MLSFLGAGRGGRSALLVRHLSLQLGLFTFGLAIAVTLRAHLGLTPWDVFHQGVARHTPLTIGEASELTGLAIILVSLALGIRPGFATVCNMVLIGFWLDRVNQWGLVPDAAGAPLSVRLAMVVGAMVLFGLATGAYISPGLGAGPRDSFMLAMTARTGLPIAVTRGIVECSVCATGFLLGGPVGLGTMMSALLVGPAMQTGLRMFGVEVARHRPRRVAAEAVAA